MRGTSLKEFARAPVGRFVGGEGWAHFCAHPCLWGALLWGRPSEAEAVALGRSLVLELSLPAVPHASLVDARQLQGGDDGAFRALERYVLKYQQPLSRWVTRLALLRPPGLRGALVAGAFEVLPRPYPIRVFHDAPEALAWLGPHCGGASPTALATALAEVIEQATGAPPLLGNLRGLLDSHPERLPVRDAARELGVSQRTLQRKLAESKTSYQREVAATKVRSAQRLLAEADAPLTTVALEAGFSSLQHMSSAFKKVAGVSPAAWRTQAQRRAVRV